MKRDFGSLEITKPQIDPYQYPQINYSFQSVNPEELDFQLQNYKDEPDIFLNFTNSHFSQFDSKLLEILEKHPNITMINFSLSFISNGILNILETAPNIKYLNFDGTSLPSNDTLKTILQKLQNPDFCPNLQYLNIWHNPISKETAKLCLAIDEQIEKRAELKLQGQAGQPSAKIAKPNLCRTNSTNLQTDLAIQT